MWEKYTPTGRLVPWMSESSTFEVGFSRILFDCVEKETTTVVFVGFAYCSRKSRIQFDLTYAFRV